VQTNGLRRVLGECAVAAPIVFAVASLVAESVQDAYALGVRTSARLPRSMGSTPGS
jgi:hypothetical protein